MHILWIIIITNPSSLHEVLSEVSVIITNPSSFSVLFFFFYSSFCVYRPNSFIKTSIRINLFTKIKLKQTELKQVYFA